MRELVVHHRYARGLAWDVSGKNNHGALTDVFPGTGAFANSLRFTQASSRIDTEPSASLGELGAFRCSVTFFLDGADPSKRYNLVEGHLSFALYFDPSFRLRATILDADGNWDGPVTPPFEENLQGWHRADCGHDGISTGWLAWDGRVIAVRNAVPGPVRPLGPVGVTVGHWPEPVDAYAFEGWISEMWLWREKPDPPVDDCCLDRGHMAGAEELLRQKGWTLSDVKEANAELLRVATRWRRRFPGPTGADVDRTAARMRDALRSQHWSEVGQLAVHAIRQTELHVPEAERQELAADILDAFGGEATFGDRALQTALLQAYLCNPGTPGDRDPWPDDKCDGRRPWGNEAAEPDPDLRYPPGRKPEGQDDVHGNRDGEERT